MNNHDLVNSIRMKTDIVDIIGERIPLVSKGKNFFGVCPFHDDTNPSMSVSRDKQIYTCFSCGATGNVFTFIMNYEHMDFKEALKYLGDKVGINTGSVKLTNTSKKYDKYYDIYKLSNKYYQNNLMTKEGSFARKYLHERDLGDDVIKEFEIGLSLPLTDDLTKLLMKKDYDLEVLNRIGLSTDNRDIYSDRIMFPLYDLNGNTVGFSGRIYKTTDHNNKYINTKETEIFKKSQLLYHYHIAKETSRTKKYVLIMEGFMDVIRASTIDVKNTVALMGTALTDEQIKMIKRLSPNVILCLDGDSAGKKATLQAGELLEKAGLNVKVISLPLNDDPDNYIVREGKNRFLSLIEQAGNYADYKIKRLKEDVDLNSDQGISDYFSKVLEELVHINDDIRIELILKKLAKEFDLSYNTLEKRFRGMKSKSAKPNNFIPIEKKKRKKNKYEKAVEMIIYHMLENDWVIAQVEREHILFPSENSRIMISEIIYYYEKYGSINIADFYTYLQGKTKLLELLNHVLADTEDYAEEITKDVLFDYFNVVKEYGKKQEIKRLKAKMLSEVDEIEQASIADEIRCLRIGEN